MKRTVILIIAIVLSLAVLGVTIKNICCNSSFWNISISECFGLLIGVWITFFIVELRNDKRRQKDLFIDLLQSLKLLIDEKSSYDFSDANQSEIWMRKRTIKLKIDLISNYSKKFSIEKYAKQIEEKYEEYEAVIDNHITNIDLFVEIKIDLHRPLDLMSQKITEVILSLYD